ncbi:DUF1934 domain-containing protein [Gorillibacterium massiliense]|uniref:DUF1934 domain-containing protein n=1 Tax=Gorillibacterium massiliense TaxID=1280390 RepID=UPI0004BC97C9|nr:DUF1934 domain-containing protein [Gorillibacterium massiliense]
MLDKLPVKLRIVSNNGDETIRQTVAGVRYVRGASQYFRYEEDEPGIGRTITLLKISPEEIRILRQGNVESEQTFAVGETRPGYYRTPQGNLQLTTRTEDVQVELDEGVGRIRWSYEMHLAGERAGFFLLDIQIQPA